MEIQSRNKVINILKEYWGTDQFVFRAEFHIPKSITLKEGTKPFGYFRNFSLNGKLIDYPLEVGTLFERKISIHYVIKKGLEDGHIFEVEVELNNDEYRIKNPFSLKIRRFTKVSDNITISKIEEKNKNPIQGVKIDTAAEDVFYGRYTKANDKFASFENVMYSNSGNLLMSNGEAETVFVSPNLELKEDAYYAFSIKQNLGKRANAIINTIEELTINPYKEFIRLRFERLNNPEANKMIANLMREIGKGMYSSKQRMIFELLQNADDAPGKQEVEFHIDISGDYFFVMHDGAPFNKNDVEAITSAAESTKRGNNKKTGYKGIGFKSVFTDSIEVWIKSGGYQFAFQRNNVLFNDFDNFYFSSERYQKYPDLLVEDKEKYRNQRFKFNGSTDIPWQVIPIWQDQLPKEFEDSNFNNFNNPVQFALKLGKKNIDEYKKAIDNITKQPQFLLFLRNTSKFRSPKNGVTVTRNDNNDIIEILKSNKGEKDQIFYYKKKVFEDIAVSDEAFSFYDIGLKKQSRVNDYNEVTYYFTDLENREIETIPPKLASVNVTEISFGITMVNNKLAPEREYIDNNTKYSSLFTYLPMEDTRFQLPFLINADFVPSSDRQKIQGDNLWNKYIMIKAAKKHVETLCNYAQEFIKDSKQYTSYLSLLLKELLPDDDTAQEIIDSYNENYLAQIQSESIIVNDRNETQLISDTILDNSGFINLFGNDLFYEIIITKKRLSHHNLDSKYLKKYDYLDIEVIDLEELAENITPELCIKIGKQIESQKIHKNPDLLIWLNKLTQLIPDKFGKIPFILHNNTLFSIQTLIEEDAAWIINKHTKDYEVLFNEIGYHTINLQLEKFTNIDNYIYSIDSYINDKLLTFNRIASCDNLSTIETTTKNNLIKFFKNNEFMNGIGESKYFGELKLFKDVSGIPRPIWELLSQEEIPEISSLKAFRIDRNEYNELEEFLKKELILKDEVFTIFILNKELFDQWSSNFSSQTISQYIKDIKEIFGWLDDDTEIQQSKLVSIPWIYIDETERFVSSEKIFWSKTFHNHTPAKYQVIKDIFQIYILKNLPLIECGELVSLLNLKTENSLITDWTVVTDINTVQSNILLDWMEEDGIYNDFFEEYTFESIGNDKWSIINLDNMFVFDGSNNILKEYILSKPLLKSNFIELDSDLCSQNRFKIGLVQGEKLLKAIIGSKSYDQKLATLLPQFLTWNDVNEFIENLSVFELEVEQEYNSNSPEHIILYNIIKFLEDENFISDEILKTIEGFRNKITIDQNPLSEYDLSDIIQFGKVEDKKFLKLSDVLEEFKGESDILDKVINNFISIRDKGKLRKFIFKTRRMKYDELCSRIEKENSTYYTVHQVVFQLLYAKYGGKFSWTKQHFDKFWHDQNNREQLQNTYKNFLDVLLQLEYIDLNGFHFYDLELINCLDKNWAIDSEKLPQWVEEWISIAQEKRIAFISKFGFNGIDSPIVKLREAIVLDNFEINKVIQHFEEAKLNVQLLWNTIKWMSNFSVEIISKNIEIIKQINNVFKLKIGNIKSIIIPIITSIDETGKKSYILKSIDTTSKLLVFNEKDENNYKIFIKLRNNNDQLVFIDNCCGKQAEHFNTEVIKLVTSLDDELLNNKSKIWEEPFYNKWQYFSKYPIYIYEGNEIPYQRKFKELIIDNFTHDLKIKNDGIYYVSNILKKDILSNLPDSFPEDALLSLKDWHYKTLQNESLLDEDSFEYKEDIDRIIQDRLGLNLEGQKIESGNAKTHAIYFLDKLGYDIAKVNNTGPKLENIIDHNGNYINCIVRSAKGGLLYLDKDHWDMLEEESTFLIVIYPGNNPRMFKDRLELLEEDLLENVLFRVSNNKQVKELNGVFNAINSDSHLILITSEKMKESLFSKLKKKSNSNPENDAAIGDDNFTF